MVGVVVIGRNEGERLTICFNSILLYTNTIIYVDSGSTDNSIDIALNLGIEVVNLDVTIPFTAARARNEGFQQLCMLEPEISFVQFVDGDCELDEAWLDKSTKYLSHNSDVAVVCGRRRERYPHASVYNMLCDIEWNTPVGETKACGGDAMMRIGVFEQVSGFNPDVIAGEEPELCLRIRKTGWKIWRLDSEMTLHDANIIRFNQWWKRNVRAGYAYALGANMHGNTPERHCIRETRRIWLWGFFIPIVTLLGGIVYPLFFLFLLIYPLQIIRLALKNKHIIKKTWLYAFFITAGKFPEMQGQLKFLFNKLTRKQSTIIEYKG